MPWTHQRPPLHRLDVTLTSHLTHDQPCILVCHLCLETGCHKLAALSTSQLLHTRPPSDRSISQKIPRLCPPIFPFRLYLVYLTRSIMWKDTSHSSSPPVFPVIWTILSPLKPLSSFPMSHQTVRRSTHHVHVHLVYNVQNLVHCLIQFFPPCFHTQLSQIPLLVMFPTLTNPASCLLSNSHKSRFSPCFQLSQILLLAMFLFNSSPVLTIWLAPNITTRTVFSPHPHPSSIPSISLSDSTHDSLWSFLSLLPLSRKLKKLFASSILSGWLAAKSEINFLNLCPLLPLVGNVAKKLPNVSEKINCERIGSGNSGNIFFLTKKTDRQHSVFN